MKNYNLPSTLLCDFYKTSHKAVYPKGTEVIYSTFTPRSNKYFPIANEVVVFGIQGFVKKYLVEYFNENFFKRTKDEVVNEYNRIIKFTLGEQYVDSEHIEKLHDLGYLPIKLKALKEGTLSPIKVPVMTIENTHPDFFWLTNYLETLISTEIWQPMTSATISHQYRKLFEEYALKTVGNTLGVDFQGHDFSMRGMSSLESAMTSGAGHLLSFTGTDTIPAILYHEKYYNANVENELVGVSIPATEHSVMSAGTSADGDRDEYETFKRIITEVYPEGFVSVVSDTYDFWKVITETLLQLKEDIMNRDGRLVVRPDSGDPVEIICGTKDIIQLHTLNGDLEQVNDLLQRYFQIDGEEVKEGTHEYKFRIGDNVYVVKATIDQLGGGKSEILNIRKPTVEEKGLIECLWEIFGGLVTDKGYKVLDSHIGAIYGDSITYERAKEICERLEAKGFASTNVVYGIGSYTFQYNTRDSFGFAMKATYAVINGEEKLLFKDPKTDDGTKRSQRGKVKVYETNGSIAYVDGLYDESNYNDDLLQDVFVDGKLVRDQSLSEIRAILNK